MAILIILGNDMLNMEAVDRASVGDEVINVVAHIHRGVVGDELLNTGKQIPLESFIQINAGVLKVSVTERFGEFRNAQFVPQCINEHFIEGFSDCIDVLIADFFPDYIGEFIEPVTSAIAALKLEEGDDTVSLIGNHLDLLILIRIMWSARSKDQPQLGITLG